MVINHSDDKLSTTGRGAPPSTVSAATPTEKTHSHSAVAAAALFENKESSMSVNHDLQSTDTDHSSSSVDSWGVDICDLEEDGPSSNFMVCAVTQEVEEEQQDGEGEDDDPSGNKESRKSVRFHQVEIREHAVILGDNPCTSSGPPVTIDWEHQANHTFDLEDYEKFIDADQRRRGAHLRMPRDIRENLLRENHTLQEMRKAQGDVRRIQSGRSTTAATDDIQHLELAWQSAVRKLKRWKNRRSGKSPELAELWLQSYKQQQQEMKGSSSSNSMKRCTSELDFAHPRSSQPGQLTTKTQFQQQQPQPSSSMKKVQSAPALPSAMRRIQSEPIF